MEINFWRNIQSVLPRIEAEPISTIREKQLEVQESAREQVQQAESFLSDQLYNRGDQVSVAISESFSAYEHLFDVAFSEVVQQRWLRIGSHRLLLPPKRLIPNLAENYFRIDA